jgi:hypothetical protein
MDLILIFILKMDIKFNTKDFTIDRLNIILICCILSLTFKSLVSLLIYNGATNTNYFFNILKSLRHYRLPNFITNVIDNKLIVRSKIGCVLPVILGVELPYSNVEDEEIRFTNTQNFESVRYLKKMGLNTINCIIFYYLALL